MSEGSVRPPERIETDRLVLRLPAAEDARAVFDGWAGDPEVTRYLSWRPHTDVDQSVAHVARVRAGWHSGSEFVWYLETKADGELLGALALRLGEHGANLGYVLARTAWGRGYMTEAVHAVTEWCLGEGRMFRVWATCDPRNRGSARVLEKAGFALEGTLRAFEWRPNIDPAAPGDALCYARVRGGDDT